MTEITDIMTAGDRLFKAIKFWLDLYRGEENKARNVLKSLAFHINKDDKRGLTRYELSVDSELGVKKSCPLNEEYKYFKHSKEKIGRGGRDELVGRLKKANLVKVVGMRSRGEYTKAPIFGLTANGVVFAICFLNCFDQSEEIISNYLDHNKQIKKRDEDLEVFEALLAIPEKQRERHLKKGFQLTTELFIAFFSDFIYNLDNNPFQKEEASEQVLTFIPHLKSFFNSRSLMVFLPFISSLLLPILSSDGDLPDTIKSLGNKIISLVSKSYYSGFILELSTLYNLQAKFGLKKPNESYQDMIFESENAPYICIYFFSNEFNNKIIKRLKPLEINKQMLPYFYNTHLYVGYKLLRDVLVDDPNKDEKLLEEIIIQTKKQFLQQERKNKKEGR